MTTAPDQNVPSADLPVRVVAEVMGRSVKLLSAYIIKNGDLIIDPKVGSHSRPDPSNWTTGERLNNYKIQIHTSPTSIDGNLITFAKNFEQSDKEREVQFTKAIKSNNKFAFVYARMFSDLRDEYYEEDQGDGVSYRIAKFNPDYISLICFVYVGKRGLRHAVAVKGVYNILHINIGVFEICILSTYVNLPTTKHANMAIYRTSKEGKLEDYEEVIDGYSGVKIDRNNAILIKRLTDLYIDQIINLPGTKDSSFAMNLIERIRHTELRFNRTPYFERLPDAAHTILTKSLVKVMKDLEEGGD